MYNTNAYNTRTRTLTHTHTHRVVYQGNGAEEKVSKNREVFKKRKVPVCKIVPDLVERYSCTLHLRLGHEKLVLM